MEGFVRLVTENHEHLRVFCISLLGQAMGLVICCIMMERRRSILKLAVFSAIKLILSMNVAFILFESFLPSSEYSVMLEAVLIGCANLSVLFMFAYTFQGGFAKAALGVAISETFVSAVMLPSVMIANLAAGREDIFSFYGKLHPADILVLVCEGLLLFIIYRYAGSLLRKYRSLRLPYPRAFMGIWCVYFAFAQLQSFVDVKSGISLMLLLYMLYLISAFGILTTVYMLYWRYQHFLQMETDFLNAQLHFLESHYNAVRYQTSQIENSQKMIEDQMQMIGKRFTKNEKTSEYANTLKEVYSNIRVGMYCSDVLIDAVLHGQEDVAKNAGIRTEYHIQGYQRGHIEEVNLAKVLILLFEYGINAGRDAEIEQQKNIVLRMNFAKNQLVILFEFPTMNRTSDKNKYKKAEMRIKQVVRTMGGTFQTEKRDARRTICIMLSQNEKLNHLQ